MEDTEIQAMLKLSKAAIKHYRIALQASIEESKILAGQSVFDKATGRQLTATECAAKREEALAKADELSNSIGLTE